VRRQRGRSALRPTKLRSRLRGTIAFAPTPFDEDGAVDIEGVRVVVSSLAKHGGPVAVCGSVGEYPALGTDEIEAIIVASVEAVDGAVPLIVGIGQGAAVAPRLAAAAASAGASGILVCPFMYSEPATEGLVEHFRRLADASGLGLIVYSTDGQVYSLPQLLGLAELDAVVGLKDEWGDLRLFSQARERIGDRWAWINGMAELQAAQYAVLGADAFTSGLINVAPHLTLAVRDAIERQDWDDLRLLATRIRPFAAMRARRPGYSTAVIKEAMAMQGQPGGGRVRPPFSPVSTGDRVDLESVMQSLAAPMQA
jgi:5-dehydro-4-deoxyglucarate dehydratase